jgi:hypothetical protein
MLQRPGGNRFRDLSNAVTRWREATRSGNPQAVARAEASLQDRFLEFLRYFNLESR